MNDISAATPSLAPASSVTSVAPGQSNNGSVVTDRPDNNGLQNASRDDEDISLDDLINADFGDDAVMKGSHKGLPDYKRVLEHIPENGRKLIQNLRNSYGQKTAEIADLRRQVEAERAEVMRERELLSNGQFAQQVRAQAEAPLQHDAWSDEGLQERINKQAAEQMAKLLAPLQQDLESQKRQISLTSFKTTHPDLTSDEMRLPIAKMLIDRPELKLEDAYYLVKGQQASTAAGQAQIAAANARQAAKDTLMKTSTGNAVRNGEAPKFKDAWQAYQYHKANGAK